MYDQSHHEETRELPGERDNARTNARFTQARKTTHGLDGQHQDVDKTLGGRVSQNDRGQGEMERVYIRPWYGQPSDRGRLKKRTEQRDSRVCYSRATEQNKLQRVLNAAAWVVSNTRKFDRGLSQLLHDELHWLDVPDRVAFKLIVTVHRCLNGAPNYTVSQKKQDTKLLRITSPNVNRFSKFFHWQTHL